MSLNDIALPPQLVADLYNRSLVDGIASVAAAKPTVPFLGSNAKNILVVVAKPKVLHLPDDETAFLTKVLQACQLGLADVAIVNWSKAPHQDAAALMEQVKAKAIILFDIKPGLFGLPDDAPVYTVINMQNRQFVLVPPLNEIEKTKEAKGHLWMALKQLFCI
jgi:hypothetical protein